MEDRGPIHEGVMRIMVVPVVLLAIGSVYSCD